MAALPRLRGLVLAGGRSRRFGEDKASYRPLGETQPLALRAIEQVAPWCVSVALSARPEQDFGFTLPPAIERVEDRFGETGPMGALLSALEKDPEAAWLLVACDLAALDQDTVAALVAGRSERLPATAFAHPVDGCPEPVCTIYEPVARRALRAVLAEGSRSLRRYLELVLPPERRLVPPHPEALVSFNRRSDFDRSPPGHRRNETCRGD